MASEFAPTKQELAEEKRIQSNRETILKSLKKDGQYQSLRHLCANTGLSAHDIIYHVETDAEIAYKLVGSVTVYFLKENDPNGKRLYLTGNNSFALAEIDETETKSLNGKVFDAEVVRKLSADGKSQSDLAEFYGVSLTTVQRYFKDFPKLREAWQSGKTDRAGKGKSSLESKRDFKPVVDLTVLENCAAEGLTVKAAAEKLGIHEKNLSTKLNHPDSAKCYREAWDKGKARYKSEPKTKIAKKDIDRKFEFDKEALGDYAGKTVNSAWNTMPGKGREQNARILECLKNGKETVDAIHQETGFDRQTIFNVLNKFVEQGKVKKSTESASCNVYKLIGEDVRSDDLPEPQNEFANLPIKKPIEVIAVKFPKWLGIFTPRSAIVIVRKNVIKNICGKFPHNFPKRSSNTGETCTRKKRRKMSR